MKDEATSPKTLIYSVDEDRFYLISSLETIMSGVRFVVVLRNAQTRDKQVAEQAQIAINARKNKKQRH